MKFQGKCFNCGKQGHKYVDCRLPKKNKPKESNAIHDITKDVDIDLTTVVSEVTQRNGGLIPVLLVMYALIRKCSLFFN